MKAPINIHADDRILEELDFKPYRNAVARRAVQIRPKPGEPSTVKIKTPWGEVLTASQGDYIVNEVDAPEDKWPVARDIFEQTYVQTRPGYFVKRAVTFLVPMTELTSGDPEQIVNVHSLEGVTSVRAGDFYLARGVKGEIWAYPKEKADSTLMPVQENNRA